MKKLLFVPMVALAFCLTSNPVSAQISVELDFSYNSPGGDFGDIYIGGVGISLHPRFNISDQMAVGVNIGGNGFAGATTTIVDPTTGSSVPVDIEIGIVSNVLGTFQYKVLDKKVSPYGEIGLGVFNFKAGSVGAATVVSGVGFEDESYFGFAPKVGVMIGFLNLYTSYTIAGDLSYTQFGLGFRFGSK